MTEFPALLYVPDPYGSGNSHFFLSRDSDIVQVRPELIGTLDTVLCYEVPTLIDELRRCKCNLPRKIVDICDAIRLLSATSRSDGGEKKWDFWKQISPFFRNRETFRLIFALSSMRSLAHDEQTLNDAFVSFSQAMHQLWLATQQRLEAENETERFFRLEVPVANIFYYRQLNGLAVNRTHVDTAIAEADSQKYSAYQEVAKILNLSPTGLSYWNIGKYLERTDFDAENRNVTGYALRDQMKLASSHSIFAREFALYTDSSRDSDTLTKLSNSDRVFPSFQSFGTVSSRILVSDPYLQELKRKYRSVITCKAENTLAYFDYSQFEPAIMAALSNDEEMIRLYNEGDVYNSLSLALFGSTDQRQLCKRVFLAFSYGMSPAGIGKLLVDKDASLAVRADVAKKVTTFFERFPALSSYKNGLVRELENIGYVSSLMGNNRRRASSGELTPKEKRWAISQVVQGTPALIFKKALIDIVANYGSDSLLLPVHDAILMQLPNATITDAVSRIQMLMVKAFQEFIPSVNIRVSVGNFAE